MAHFVVMAVSLRTCISGDNLVPHRKKLFTPNLIRFIHLNLAISLFLAYLTFVAGVELARDHKVSECGCFCLKIVLHHNLSALILL